MSPVSDAIQAVRDFAQQSISTFDDLPPTDRQLFDAACFHDLMKLCHSAAPSERNDVLASLAPAIIAVPDAFQASRLAMLCGILVEWGADPAIAIPAILDRLTMHLASAAPLAGRVSADNEAVLFAEKPDAFKAWKGLSFMILPAMTMLCLDARARQAARRNASLVAAVRALTPAHREVRFLDRLFGFVDDEDTIVLHPLETKGFRVRLEAVSSNFHLFSLLQGALVGDPAAGFLTGPRANRKVIATATGAVPHDRLITDAPVWHYSNWTGLLPDGSPDTTRILGEQTPRDIPYFEGDRVILLAPPLAAARGWDSSFFTNLHDLLRSKAEVMEILSVGEIEMRLRRMRNAVR